MPDDGALGSSQNRDDDPPDVDSSAPLPADQHEDEFDEEYGDQQPTGDPNDHHHSSSIQLTGQTGDDAPAKTQPYILHFACNLAPDVDGDYGYDVEAYQVQVDLTGSTSGYLNPTTNWTIQGATLGFGDPRDGIGTASGSVTVDAQASILDPSRGELVSSGNQKVTVAYSATPVSLQITNNPDDGNYELTISFSAFEDWRDPSSSSEATRTLQVVGQRVAPSAQLSAAQAECARATAALAAASTRQPVLVGPSHGPVPPEPDPLLQPFNSAEEFTINPAVAAVTVRPLTNNGPEQVAP